MNNTINISYTEQAFDEFFYESMFLMFSLVGFLYFAVKKLLMYKNILKNFLKKVLYYIIFLPVNLLATVLYFSYPAVVNVISEIKNGIKIREELLNEMKFEDDFEGEEYVPVYCLQRIVSC